MPLGSVQLRAVSKKMLVDCIMCVKFEEINLQFEKVQDVIKFEKVQNSLKSTINHKCNQNTLSNLSIVTMLNCMQYNAL